MPAFAPMTVVSNPHPDYPTLEVVVGGKAKAGAFYVTVPGKYLSHIANNAYGDGKIIPTLRINKSLWNQQNCIYRKKSTSCSSTKVPGPSAANQTSWDPGAWIALCPGDLNELAMARGYQFQVIWVPTVDGKEPWDLYKPPKGVPIGPAPGPEPGPEPEPEPVPVAKAGFPWWALLGLAAAAGIAYVATRPKKKKK